MVFNQFDQTCAALSASNLVLAPNAVSQTHLSGRIVPQTGANLDVLGELFSGFLAGQNLTLVTKGQSVQLPGSTQPVNWLTTAFQTLSLEVILPGEKKRVWQTHSYCAVESDHPFRLKRSFNKLISPILP